MPTLIVSPFTPRPGSGRGLRTVGVARALACLDDVEIAYVEFDGTRVAEPLADDARVTLRALHASRGVRRAVTYVRARVAGTPRAFARGVSPELVGLDVARFDRVVADGPTAAAALALVARNPHVVYNAHNLESTFRLELSDGARHYGSVGDLRAFEVRLLTNAYETWVPTREEARLALQLVPSARVRYVPNVVDVQGIAPVSPNTREARVLFVADFSYEPNRNAARFLVDEVAPKLWRLAPDARLTLVGRALPPPDTTDQRVEILGYVDDLADAYARSTCVVVPLLVGGGSPLKLVEAMAYGLPVVATGRAASSLEGAEDGVHYLEANDAEQFAMTLARALSGDESDIGRNGRLLAEAEFSIEALVGHLR